MTAQQKAQAEAAELYPRLHPTMNYNVRRATLTELLLMMPGGMLWHSGGRFKPKSERIGPGAYLLRFVRIEE